jgi:hypothetical protein
MSLYRRNVGLRRGHSRSYYLETPARQLGASLLASSDIASTSSTPTTHLTLRLPEKEKNSQFALHMKISISGGGRSGLTIKMGMPSKPIEVIGASTRQRCVFISLRFSKSLHCFYTDPLLHPLDPTRTPNTPRLPPNVWPNRRNGILGCTDKESVGYSGKWDGHADGF